jgi:hypothetical protein
MKRRLHVKEIAPEEKEDTLDVKGTKGPDAVVNAGTDETKMQKIVTRTLVCADILTPSCQCRHNFLHSM